MQERIAERVRGLRRAIKAKGLDALLVSNGENRRYLSGFTGEETQMDESAGVLFISRKKLVLATDSRYEIQAMAEAAGYEIICYREGLAKALPGIGKMLGAKTLGFESARMTCKQHREIEQALAAQKAGIEMVPTENTVEELRAVKDDLEIEETRRALEVAETSFAGLMAALEPGMSEREAAWLLEKSMREAGADRISFPTIVAAGPNSARPHATPGDCLLEKGRPLLFDWGAVLNGYCSDTSRTTILGSPDGAFMTVFDTVVEAQRLAIAAIRGGVSSQSIDRIARRHIEEQGYRGKFGHSLGHGTGLAVHEAPLLSPLKDSVLLPGMIVTVEPGIYLPEWGGVRVENQVLVREEGAEVLNKLGAGPSFAR